MSLDHAFQDLMQNLHVLCPENHDWNPPGRKCYGWLLTDFDTVHACPCHSDRAIEENHPEYEPPPTPQEEYNGQRLQVEERQFTLYHPKRTCKMHFCVRDGVGLSFEQRWDPYGGEWDMYGEDYLWLDDLRKQYRDLRRQGWVTTQPKG